MAVPLNEPTPTGTDKDVTPTGFAALTGQSSGKVVGSDAADRGTLYDLEKDNDQVINLGAGDDVFVFGPNTQSVDINGIVKMGDGFDRVFLNYRVEDFVFTTRSDGGIKVQYLAEPDGKGDAVTFYGAEEFTFRNIDRATGTDYTTTTYTHDQLYALVTAAQAAQV
jgi:hypothetical protein